MVFCQVLEEIEQSHQVVVNPEPVLSIQLVLNVPEFHPLDMSHHHSNLDSDDPGAPHEGKSRTRRKSLTKAVKFTDDDSGTDNGNTMYLDDINGFLLKVHYTDYHGIPYIYLLYGDLAESDYEEEDDDDEDYDDEDLNQSRNRFAYDM